MTRYQVIFCHFQIFYNLKLIIITCIFLLNAIIENPKYLTEELTALYTIIIVCVCMFNIIMFD